jgi:hypothetical protein
MNDKPTNSIGMHKPNLDTPKIEQVGPYRNGTAPKAAKFGVGASNLAEIKEATDRRRAHNEGLSGRFTGPRGPAIGHDAK